MITRTSTTPDTTTTGPDLLTITEVADLLRTPVATLRYWRHLGTGPHSFLVGRAVRYYRHEVLDWLHQQSSDGHGPNAA